MPSESEPGNLTAIENLGLTIKAARNLAAMAHLLPRTGIHYVGTDMLPVLRDYLRTYDVEEFVSMVSRISSIRASHAEEFDSELRDLGLAPQDVLRDYQFGFMLRILLDDEEQRNGRGRPATVEEMIHCSELVSNVLCQADSLLGEAISGDAESLLHRLAYQQFPDLEGSMGLVRGIAVYRHIAQSSQCPGGEWLDSAFEGRYGLHLDEFWLMALGLYGFVVSNPGTLFGPDVFTTSDDFPTLAPSAVERFFHLLSCSYEEYRSYLDHPATGKEGFEPYNLNPLMRWPILEVTSDRYVVPLPRLLMARASVGLYYDFVQIDQDRFGNILGRAFEMYVGKILGSIPGGPRLLEEMTYWANGRREVTCDWIMVDGSTAVLIECRTRALRALAKITGDRALMQCDLCRPHGVVDAVRRVSAVKRAIEEGAPGLDSLHRIDRVFGVVVTLDDFYMPNSHLIRDIVDRALLSQGKERLSWQMQLAHVGGLEWLAGLLETGEVSLADLMKKKVDHYAWREMDFKNCVLRLGVELGLGGAVDPWPSVLKTSLDICLRELRDQFGADTGRDQFSFGA